MLLPINYFARPSGTQNLVLHLMAIVGLRTLGIPLRNRSLSQTDRTAFVLIAIVTGDGGRDYVDRQLGFVNDLRWRYRHRRQQFDGLLEE